MNPRNLSLVSLKTVLPIALLVEVGMITFWRQNWGDYGSPLVWSVAAILGGLLPLIWVAINRSGTESLLSRPPIWRTAILMGLSVISLLAVATLFPPVFDKFPLTVEHSDIAPQIRILVQRFLKGEMPYRPITEWGYELFSPYMPLQWLPFSLAEIGGFDYRWVAFGVFGIAVVWMNRYIARLSLPLPMQVLIALLPAAFLWAIVHYEPTILGRTVEMLIAGYYLMLALSIFSRHDAIRALGLILCLLSKYAILFWLPLYAVSLLLYDNKKSALRIGLFVVGGILLLYVFPFMTRDPAIFFKGFAYHSKVTFNLWHPMHWQPADAKPFLLFEGMGFAGWLYDTIGGDVASKQRILAVLQYGGAIVITALLGLWYHFQLREYLGYRIFLLLALKLYLVWFYAFIALPYKYYFIVPAVVSLIVLAETWTWRSETEGFSGIRPLTDR